jgi:hypothetical protein
VPLGTLAPERVKQSIDLVAGAFTLKNPVTPADIYAPGFVGR